MKRDHRIAVVTDSNCGLGRAEAMSENIYLVPMPVIIDGREYFEGNDLSSGMFYQVQRKGAKITTSQPSLSVLFNLWTSLLQNHEEVIYIPMSSALSSAANSAAALAGEFHGKVHVVDDRHISATQYQSAVNAVKMADAGMDGAAVKEWLESHAGCASIYITVDTLEYLKKGGRITPAAEKIGSLLRIKPVLKIDGGKLDVCALKKGVRSASATMIDMIDADLSGRFPGKKMRLFIACSEMDPAGLEKWVKAVEGHFGREAKVMDLPLSIAAHTGPGCFGIGVSEEY